MVPHIIDTHAHLDRFEDPQEILAECWSRQVSRVVAVGMDPSSIEATVQIAREAGPQVRVVAGLHPHRADDHERLWPEVERQIRDLAAEGLLAGVGETGFDQFRAYSELTNQRVSFAAHCNLAHELDVPLVIHSRAADQLTLDALGRDAEGLAVVLHCFALSDHLDEVRERGYFCSFAGNVTYPSAADLRTAASELPLERLLVETDSPYLAPVPYRGTTNRPAQVRHTFDALVELRDESAAEVAAAMWATVTNVFGWESQ